MDLETKALSHRRVPEDHPAALAAPVPPDELVRQTIEEVLSIIRSDEDLSGRVDSNGMADDETFFVFGIVKNFSLYSN